MRQYFCHGSREQTRSLIVLLIVLRAILVCLDAGTFDVRSGRYISIILHNAEEIYPRNNH
jgi:hypothetical protein